MRLGFTNNGFRKLCAVVLVGTIAGGVTYGQAVSAKHQSNNEFLKGYYYDEDVKKNREELLGSITSNGKKKVKTFGKREVIPKTIIK